jgi:hypothetical protein
MTERHVSECWEGAYLRNMVGRGRHQRVGDRRGPGEDAGHVVVPLPVAGTGGYTHGRPPTPRLVTIVGRTGAADIVSIAAVSLNRGLFLMLLSCRVSIYIDNLYK